MTVARSVLLEFIYSLENGPPDIDCWCGNTVPAIEWLVIHGPECPDVQRALGDPTPKVVS